MPPTPQKKKNKRKTPYPTQEPISANSGAPSQRRPSCAKGCQGYSTTNCKELNKAVKAFLPLGSQEWDHPTGNPKCPETVCEAKRIQIAMDARAHVMACNDVEKDDGDSDEAGVKITNPNEGPNVEVLSQDSEDADQPVEDNLDKELPPPLVFSDDISKQPASPTRQSPQSSFSAYAAQPSGSKTRSCWAIAANSQKTFAQPPRGSKPAVGLEQQMTNYFDPAKRKKQDFENGMTQFYANQLSDANKTITSLCEEKSNLHNWKPTSVWKTPNEGPELLTLLGANPGTLGHQLTLHLTQLGYVVIATVSSPDMVAGLELEGLGWRKALVLDPLAPQTSAFTHTLAASMSSRFPLSASAKTFTHTIHQLPLVGLINCLPVSLPDDLRPVEALAVDQHLIARPLLVPDQKYESRSTLPRKLACGQPDARESDGHALTGDQDLGIDKPAHDPGGEQADWDGCFPATALTGSPLSQLMRRVEKIVHTTGVCTGSRVAVGAETWTYMLVDRLVPPSWVDRWLCLVERLNGWMRAKVMSDLDLESNHPQVEIKVSADPPSMPSSEGPPPAADPVDAPAAKQADPEDTLMETVNVVDKGPEAEKEGPAAPDNQGSLQGSFR
ncbi:hypothetical protein PCASD_00557 [Puccinia coronata f. sp. avenae]|uniref:Uncharacterized protein n=1 Tax=Puccinia coronata f. sp. avenae TaxID=200324 RepID=A0A2N5VNR6_9BASI|nr:hypothetical protein PCASD_00557 [Puccinia coronata f. sp. avenae]